MLLKEFDGSGGDRQARYKHESNELTDKIVHVPVPGRLQSNQQ
jgi:hypothetical protein